RRRQGQGHRGGPEGGDEGPLHRERRRGAHPRGHLLLQRLHGRALPYREARARRPDRRALISAASVTSARASSACRTGEPAVSVARWWSPHVPGSGGGERGSCVIGAGTGRPALAAT